MKERKEPFDMDDMKKKTSKVEGDKPDPVTGHSMDLEISDTNKDYLHRMMESNRIALGINLEDVNHEEME